MFVEKSEGDTLSLKEVIYQPLSVNVNDDNTKRRKYHDSIFLYFVVSTVCLVLFTTGSDFVWTSPVIPMLRRNNSDENPLGKPVTPLEESLIAGLCIFGAVIGTLLLGQLPDIYGRKNCLLFVSILKLMAYVALAFANKILLYYISRLTLGLCFGMAIALVPMFTAEICEDHNRGRFGAFAGLFMTLGNLYGFIIGSLFSVRIFTLLSAAPLLLNISGLMLFIPESPIYLLNRGDRKGAKRALYKIRNNQSRHNIQQDLEQIEKILETSKKKSSYDNLSIFKTKWLRNALIAATGVGMVQQFSGITAIVGFIGPVFDSANCKLSGNTSAVIVGFVQVVSFGLASNIIDRIGRRILLLLSCIMAAISLTSLGIYFYMLNAGMYLTNISWISVTCLILFFVSYCIGLGPVPLVIMSELFPAEVKSFAASIITFFSGLSALVSIACFPFILSHFSVAWCFWLFSIFCCGGAIFIYFFLPETKGKSINDIQKIFNS